MPESNKKFHEFALKSILFKGRTDWYFCYLKSEKIAHVLGTLSSGEPRLRELAGEALHVPGTIARLAAGELDAAVVLADIFALLSEVRAAVVVGTLDKETGALLCREYELLAERLVIGSHPSPFIASDDLRVAALQELEAPALREPARPFLKDTSRDARPLNQKGQTERMSQILSFIQKNKQASIKDIAAVIKGCSEKTIQRELLSLIQQGLIKKVGERRWSVYIPA
jgi:hypothetical protein